jgi:hypothetical protein
MLFAWDDPLPGLVRIWLSLWIAARRKLGARRRRLH